MLKYSHREKTDRLDEQRQGLQKQPAVSSDEAGENPTLIGSALGFYFGGREREEEQEEQDQKEQEQTTGAIEVQRDKNRITADDQTRKG